MNAIFANSMLKGTVTVLNLVLSTWYVFVIPIFITLFWNCTHFFYLFILSYLDISCVVPEYYRSHHKERPFFLWFLNQFSWFRFRSQGNQYDALWLFNNKESKDMGGCENKIIISLIAGINMNGLGEMCYR